MNLTSIRLLELLVQGPKTTAKLADLLGIKNRQLARVIKNLIKKNYIKKENNIFKLDQTPKTTLFRDVAKTMNVKILLCESNEAILCNIDENITLDQLMKKSKLSKATTYKSISDLQSIGAIVKNKDTININKTIKHLELFVKLLKIENEEKYESHNTEIIYRNNSTILRKTLRGNNAKGNTTGFSLFSDYGIQYNTVYDYFCEQEKCLDIQDVLLHAVCCANQENDKMGLVMAMVFYLKHKEKMDISELRKKSSELEISKIWLDIEAYINRKELKNANLFLPWNEFLIKTELYNIPTEKYTLPEPNHLLFEEISKQLQEPKTIYLFGGENMRIKSLKDSTKDCDIVVENKADFDTLAQIICNIGYMRVLKTSYLDQDKRIKPDDIFVHEQKSRIDLFTTTIMQDLSLSDTMKEKMDVRDYGKLKVGLLRNEHVFLLKAVANREGDIQDMISLVEGSLNTPQELQHDSFDWEMIWHEILKQEKMNPTRDFTGTIFEQISYLVEQSGIVVPFFDKLKMHVIDQLITRLLRGNTILVKEFVRLLIGGDVTESIIRNRIDALAKAGIIAKKLVGRTTLCQLLKNNEFPKSKFQINFDHLKTYLDWRFFIREKASDQYILEFVKELKKFGFQTVGEIDEIVRNSIQTLAQYENEEFSNCHFNIVDAARICIGLHYPEIGKKQSSKYFIHQFKKYNRIAKSKFVAKTLKKI